MAIERGRRFDISKAPIAIGNNIVSIGDLVSLKNLEGIPNENDVVMTVSYFEGSGVGVIWFDNDKHIQQTILPKEALMPLITSKRPE